MGNIVTDNLPPLPTPEGFRTRYRSEQGMVRNYPWGYSDRAIRKTPRPEHEDQDLFTAEQMQNYARAAVDRASLEAVPDVDAIAQFIRTVDGNHDMGAAALAERLHEWLSAAPAQPAQQIQSVDTASLQCGCGDIFPAAQFNDGHCPNCWAGICAVQHTQQLP